MASNQKTNFSLLVIFCGLLSFVLGILAENKKPAFGTPIQGKDAVICKFPSDPSISLGALSTVALIVAAVVGHVAVYFPYKGKTVPCDVLFRSTTLRVFFIIAELVSAAGVGLLMWATITEGLHRSQNIHRDLDYQCPTAKTGLFGGAAFLALDAALFWLVCQMLSNNVRSDLLEVDDAEGEYGQVYATEFNGTYGPAA